MKENLTITHDQFQQYVHCRRTFELNSQEIMQLCSSEQDDVTIGFELGRIYSHLRECHSKMLEIETEISNQNK